MSPSEPVLAFDIETYGAWDALSATLQGYLDERDHARGLQPDDGRAARQSVSLLPGLARVVAIGLWTGEDAPAEALSLQPGAAPGERVHEGVRVRVFADEADLLRAFWTRAAEAAGAGARLVTYAGRGFDGPMLALRSAVLGVPASLDLVGKRGALRPHCDVGEVLSFFGATRRQLSLAYWCEVFGVPSPKLGLNGAEVGGAYERGEHDAIAAYAVRDAEAAGRIYARLAGTLLGVMERGSA